MVCRNHGPNTVDGCVACKPPVRQQLAQVQHERDLLANILGRLLYFLNVTRSASLTGPELLAAAESYMHPPCPACGAPDCTEAMKAMWDHQPVAVVDAGKP